MRDGEPYRLHDGAVVGIVGGGPAGAFFAIQLLSGLRGLNRNVKVLIFEQPHRLRACAGETGPGTYRGCPYCAGGLSPPILDALAELGIQLPPEILQSEIKSVITHGHWKNMNVPVPSGRHMITVFRGRRPPGRSDADTCLDCYLLDLAVQHGAELIDATVCDARYGDGGKPVLELRKQWRKDFIEVDYAVFVGGINPEPSPFMGDRSTTDIARQLLPRYEPPRSRKTLIFELEPAPESETLAACELHLFHVSSSGFKLEMCSILPKREYLTVSLIGKSIDTALEPSDNLKIVERFLEEDAVKSLLQDTDLNGVRCICEPRIVVGTAKFAVGQRAAAIGDMAASRLYKDGILSALITATSLAKSLTYSEKDDKNLIRQYQKTLRNFRRDSACGQMVFLLYRAVFSRSSLSRMIYQAFCSEIKWKPPERRRIEKLLWRIASGDDGYASILAGMLSPQTLWVLFRHGLLTTLHNVLVELVFGMSWRDIHRYPTAVRKELVTGRATAVASQLGRKREFENLRPDVACVHTLAIRRPVSDIFECLGKIGDPLYQWPRPHRMTIEQCAGKPNVTGSIMRCKAFGGLLRIDAELEQVTQDRLLLYRVRGGYLGRGVIAIEITPGSNSELSVYLGLNHKKSEGIAGKVSYRIRRALYPRGIHDALLNHALCELKNIAESVWARSSHI